MNGTSDGVCVREIERMERRKERRKEEREKERGRENRERRLTLKIVSLLG